MRMQDRNVSYHPGAKIVTTIINSCSPIAMCVQFPGM